MNPTRTLVPKRPVRPAPPVQPAQQDSSQPGILERPRFYAGQLMTPAELILEHNYLMEKMRRHNRFLHGWGVVCGALVCRVRAGDSQSRPSSGQLPCPDPQQPTGLDPWIVSITPGYILGPYGDEIMIDCEVRRDVRTSCTTRISGDPCPPAPDPWRSPVVATRGARQVYLAIRYREIPTRPVPSHPSGCGCEELACEYSRFNDGFDICTLDECPLSHGGTSADPFDCALRPCPSYPSDPWVVLARIILDTSGIRTIDYDCRRMVVSFANTWCVIGQEQEKAYPVSSPSPQPQHIPADIQQMILEHTDLTDKQLENFEQVLKVPELPATQLTGVQRTSALGKKLETAHMTIRRVADTEREKFMAFATEGVDGARAQQMRNQSLEVWDHAQAVVAAVGKLVQPNMNNPPQ